MSLPIRFFLLFHIIVYEFTRFQNFNVLVSRYIQQMFVSTDNQLDVTSNGTFNEFVVVWIFTDGFWNASCLNEFPEDSE